jgi:hypothetical protein
VSVVSTSGWLQQRILAPRGVHRTKTSGALALYVDGVTAGTATASTLSLNGPTTMNFGRIQYGANYFAGSLDEVAMYSTVLAPAAIAAHHDAGQ